MEGIPEKDMEERRRLLEQKTQGKVWSSWLSVISMALCLNCLICILCVHYPRWIVRLQHTVGSIALSWNHRSIFLLFCVLPASQDVICRLWEESCYWCFGMSAFLRSRGVSLICFWIWKLICGILALCDAGLPPYESKNWLHCPNCNPWHGLSSRKTSDDTSFFSCLERKHSAYGDDEF